LLFAGVIGGAPQRLYQDENQCHSYTPALKSARCRPKIPNLKGQSRDRFTAQLFLCALAAGVVGLIGFWPGKYRLNLRSHFAVGGAGGREWPLRFALPRGGGRRNNSLRIGFE
jgi:hypothetical protein